MSTTKTPKADALIEQFGFVAHPAVMAYYAALCETERELAELRESKLVAPIKITASSTHTA